MDADVATPGGTEILTPAQCWELLGTAEVGRLAVAAAGDVDIFPVNFVVDQGSVVFRTAEGTKLVEVVLAGRVAFEADGYDPGGGQAWSVVLKAQAEVLERFDDLYRAQALPLFSWNAAPKERYVRLRPDRLTGRRFRVQRTGPDNS
jgi:nitroimidazol reductase NimA-like FMN-containing flavoprotein (pyridoxamine 5'-phosphate oxidase superfamily)